jgi:membrane protein DedA with SNARE-associated domain
VPVSEVRTAVIILLTYIGYGLGANFRQVDTYLDPVSYVVLAVIVVFYIWRVVRHKGQHAAA